MGVVCVGLRIIWIFWLVWVRLAVCVRMVELCVFCWWVCGGMEGHALPFGTKCGTCDLMYGNAFACLLWFAGRLCCVGTVGLGVLHLCGDGELVWLSLEMVMPEVRGQEGGGGSTVGGRGLLIVISGPSGVGKTTITHQLVERLGASFSVSMTTRAKTAADREGVDYYFVDEGRFRSAIEGGELLEWAEVFGNYYGTPRGPVEAELAAGRDVILEIDVAGGTQVKGKLSEAVTLFVLPPSEEVLLERLRGRAREDEATIQRRFAEAKREIGAAKTGGAYEHFVVNEDLERAIEEAVGVVEGVRVERDGE